MKLLIDTHCLIWWFTDSDQLSTAARSHLTDLGNTILVSAAIAWELSIKTHKGKLNAFSSVTNLVDLIQEEGFSAQPIAIEDAVRAGLLPWHHRDPFDRMLVAQSQSLNAPILSADTALDKYDVLRIW